MKNVKSPMKIGFDVSQTGSGKAGCGYFADSIICSLAKVDQDNQYLLYKSFGYHYCDLYHEKIRHIKQKNFIEGLRHLLKEQSKEFWQTASKNIESKLGFPDIIHANNFFCPDNLNRAKLVYTLYDLSFIDNTDFTTEENRLVCFEGVFKASLFADFIISISEYSKKHFLNTFPYFNEENVEIVYPASRFTYSKNILQPKRLENLKPDQFWLSVGTIEPRKNQKRLILAYKKLKITQRNIFPLVLAGGSGWLMHDIEQYIDDLGLKEDVILLGYVDDEELQWLYQNCFCSIYPSLFEGFGLPVLEAMSLKAPVITSNTTSIPEIVADSEILIDPLNSDAIFDAMLHLASKNNIRMDLKNKGYERSKLFSWEKSAQKILNIYEKLMEKQTKRLKGHAVNKTALITGICGQDGYYLSNLLSNKNYKVIGLDVKQAIEKHGNNDFFKNIEMVSGDLTDLNSISEIIAKYRPDEIYNLASQSLPSVSWDLAIETGNINGLGAHRLFEAVRQIVPNCRVYQASSSEMFGKVLETPQNENTPFNPSNPYAAAKLYAHNIAKIYCDTYGMFISCGILFNHESPLRPLKFISQKITYAAACLKLGIQTSSALNEFGEPIVNNGKVYVGNLDISRDWGFAGDYVEAMWLMLQQEKPDDFVIGTGKLRTIRELCKEAFACVGLNWEDYVIVDPRLFRPIETGSTVADASKAKQILNWQAETSFEELIESMVNIHLKNLEDR